MNTIFTNPITSHETIAPVKRKRESSRNKIITVFIFGLLTLTSLNLFANNVQISNVKLTGQDKGADFSLVNFDITWENSWRNSAGTKNWDACWVFVKFRKIGGTTWSHATLNWVNGTGSGDGHTAPSGSTIKGSQDKTGGSYGVFIYRSTNGTGNVNYTGVKLRWNYGADGVADGDKVEICVYAIEMVYVTPDSFKVGSGGTEEGSFTNGSWTSGVSIPLSITSESALTIGAASGNLWGTNPSGGSSGNSGIGGAGTLPAGFPKGYAGFYCMKYEITQEQYVAFLNKLTRAQQDTRTSTSLGSGITSVTNRYVMSNTSSMTQRNGIRCDGTIDATAPITFYCDYNGNGIGNESDDGQNIADNFLNWGDLSAYLDWAALRPITELEYEKACRGNQTPVADEYAWGSTAITNAYGSGTTINAGTNSETSSNSSANCIYTGSAEGPMRVGCFGQGVNTRAGTGASYYGIMELSGNLWERSVTVGRTVGRGFTGINGNGAINVSGFADVSNWPVSTTGEGAGYRGGTVYFGNALYMRVSDRTHAANYEDYIRMGHYGGRGGRSAP